MWAACMPETTGSQKVSDPLELNTCAFLSHHVGAENLNPGPQEELQVPWPMGQSLQCPLLLPFRELFLFYMWECIPSKYVSSPHDFSAFRTQKGSWIPWACSSIWLWGAAWVLGTQPRSSTEQQILLTPGSSLHPAPPLFFVIVKAYQDQRWV